MPTGEPANWVNPDTEGNGGGGGNGNGGGDGNGGGGNGNGGGEPPEEKLYTPNGSQFFQGMFTANDMLFRNGGTIDSEFYNGLRRNILASLAQTAADNGRTQNTAEEIALAQGKGGYSASGLFDPNVAGFASALGF
jgi:hypothetical protein